MRTVRTYLLAALVLTAPAVTFAQGAPPSKGAPPPAAQPATTTSAAPTTTPAPSQYDIATEVDAAMSEKARALFKEGNAFFRDAKYAQAQASYKAAWALELRSQQVVRNLGLTELELHKYRDAAEHLTIALRLSDPKDPKRPKMEEEVKQARAQVGTITMKIEVDGVEIIDMATGQKYMTPLADPVFVNPGEVHFRIRREGYESQEKVFNLKVGQETTAEIKLERPAGTATTGAPTGPTVPTSAPRSKVPGFVIGGIGVVGLIAGGALVGVAVGKQGENRTNAPKDGNGNPTCFPTASSGEAAACADLRATAGSINAMGNAGVGLLVGGGVVLAAGVGYLIFASRKAPADTKQASSQVLPVVGTNGGGLVWTGSF